MDSVFLIDGAFFSRRVKAFLSRPSQSGDVSDFVGVFAQNMMETIGFCGSITMTVRPLQRRQ